MHVGREPEIKPTRLGFHNNIFRTSNLKCAKIINLSCNIAAKRVDQQCWAFSHPHQTCLATNQVVNRFEHGR